MLSGRYFLPAAPLTWVKCMPARDVASTKASSAPTRLRAARNAARSAPAARAPTRSLLPGGWGILLKGHPLALASATSDQVPFEMGLLSGTQLRPRPRHMIVSARARSSTRQARLLIGLAILPSLGGCGRGDPTPAQSGGLPGGTASRTDKQDAEVASAPARAAALAAAGEERRAAELLSEAMPRLPASEQGAAYALLAELHHAVGSNHEALEAAEAAARLGVRSAPLLYVLGESERRLLRLGEARATLAKLLEIEPRHALGKLSLARILFRAEDPAAALPLFEDYLADAPPDDALRNLALL